MRVFCYFKEPASYTIDLAKNIYEKNNIKYCFINSYTEAKSNKNITIDALDRYSIFSRIKFIVRRFRSSDFLIINGYNNYKVNINSEIMLNISHSLITNEIIDMSKIKTIYSHPQALAQCKIYLSKKAPQAQLINTSSTSAALKHIINDGITSAAIAHARNAKSNNLNVIEENIQDSPCIFNKEEI